MSGDQSDAPTTPSVPPPSTAAPTSPPGADELTRIARAEALLERMMERKLALLEADYEECLAADRRAVEAAARAAEAQAGDSSLTPADVALANGYVNAAELDVDAEEEQWSEAWTAFKADMQEEERRIQLEEKQEGEAHDAAPPSSAPSPAPLHAPLTAEKVVTIKSLMSTIRLRPPPWALGQPEEVWMARILERAGFARRSASAAAAPHEAQGEEAEERQRRLRRKAKRKARKATQAEHKHAEQGDPQSSVVKEEKRDDPFNEFEPSFPAIDPQPAAAKEGGMMEPSSSLS